VLPRVRVREGRGLPEGTYVLQLQGCKLGEGILVPGCWLAIHPGGERAPLEGIATTDPAYHLPAIWIQESQRIRAREAGYTVVDASTVFMTHFTEQIKRHAASLLTRDEVESLLAHLRQQHAGLVDELVPNVMTTGELQKVLQGLLREKVPIRNLALICEVLVDAARSSKDPDMLNARVRSRLGHVICETLLDREGALHVMTLDAALEQTLYDGLRQGEGGSGSLVLEPRLAEKILKKMLLESERMAGSNHMPVILCAPEVRASLRKLTERMIPHLHVLALTEVPAEISLKSFAVLASQA
jgi:flagellar biosynthesis protein FlhA